MSDDVLIVVPRDPTHVPSASSQRRLLEALGRLAPKADEVTSETVEQIAFFDAGENFERVGCPACNADVDMSWWQDRMDQDFRDGGFRLEKYVLPCCETQLNLNELTYDWPQAFGRFCAEVRNPGIGQVDGVERARLEQALGVPVVVLRRHV